MTYLLQETPTFIFSNIAPNNKRNPLLASPSRFLTKLQEGSPQIQPYQKIKRVNPYIDLSSISSYNRILLVESRSTLFSKENTKIKHQKSSPSKTPS
jgi:hypothetical protein